MKKQIENKLEEIRQRPTRTRMEATVNAELITCLEGLLKEEQRKPKKTDEVEDMTA